MAHALFCFIVGVVWYRTVLLIYITWHWANNTIIPVSVQQPWWIWVNRWHRFIGTLRYNHCKLRDHFVHAPSQWETTLHYNVVSHWLDPFTKWSLQTQINLNKNRVHSFWNILFVYNAEKNKEISTTALDSLFSSTTVPSPANRDPIVSSHLPKLRLLLTFRAPKMSRMN